MKELIKVSGFQVAPAELEGDLLDHLLISGCAVIPVADERSGKVPRALVVFRKDVHLSQATARMQLLNWVADHKSKHKHMWGGIRFVPDVPKSASGKILRSLLRDSERARLLQSMTPVASVARL